MKVSPYCYKHSLVKSGTSKACTFLLLTQQERILRRKRLRLLSLQLFVLLVLGVGAPLATTSMICRQSKPIHPLYRGQQYSTHKSLSNQVRYLPSVVFQFSSQISFHITIFNRISLIVFSFTSANTDSYFNKISL